MLAAYSDDETTVCPRELTWYPRLMVAPCGDSLDLDSAERPHTGHQWILDSAVRPAAVHQWILDSGRGTCAGLHWILDSNQNFLRGALRAPRT